MDGAACRDFELFGALARRALLDLEALRFATQTLGRNAPFGFTSGELGRGCIDLAKTREDRFEISACPCQGARRSELAFARLLDLARERRDASIETFDRRYERGSFGRDARRVFTRLGRLPLERFASRQCGGVLSLEERELPALGLRLRAQLLELQLAPIVLRTHPREFAGGLRRRRSIAAAQLFVLRDLLAQRDGFGAARSARAQVPENL